MPMTVVVTRNLPLRFRGFLASCMCEIAPGVYTAPRMTQGVRERVWHVLEGWFRGGPDQAIVMTWPDGSLPGGQEMRALGVPRKQMWNRDGIYLSRRLLSDEELAKLEEMLEEPSEANEEPEPAA